MAKHITTLEFEVYGKKDIDKLRDALKQAGITLEYVESTAVDTQREIHNLAQTTKMATARLDNLSRSQKQAVKGILATIAAQRKSPTYKPWIREEQLLESKQAADRLKEEAKLEREKERNHRREMARIERENRESKRRLARMIGLDTGGRTDLMGKSVSGPMRVIAYDLVRRTLTEIYALVNKIGNSISNWIIDGIKFNDELARSQTFFTSLGILGFKGVTGQQMTVAEASVSKDPKVAEMYAKSVDNSEKVMRRMMAVSALTGQDLGEIVSSTRQAMTDLLNKLNKEGKPGTYLKNTESLNDVSERMVKLASVLRMADPQNRKLSFHMVGLQELFSGTTGEGKDKKKESAGLQNVRSILMREGIRIGEERARKITQYVNTGNLQAAMDVVQDSLERSGLGFEQLSNMMNSTLQPAIDGTMMYLRIFNKIFTTDLYKQVVKPFFQATLRHFSIMEQNKTFVSGIEKLGKQFADAADSIIDDFAGIIDYLTLVPDFTTKEGKAKYDKQGKEVLGFFTTMTGMENVISTIKGGSQVMYAVFKVIGKFIWGLMSARGGQGLEDFAKQVEAFGETAQRWGRELREAFEWMLKAIKENKVEIFGFTFSLSGLIKSMLLLAVVLRGIKLAVSMFTGTKDLFKAFGWDMGKTGNKWWNKELDPRKKAAAAGTAANAGSGDSILKKITNALKWLAEKVIGGLLTFGFGFISIFTKLFAGPIALLGRAAASVGKFFSNKVWEIKAIWKYVIPVIKNNILNAIKSWPIIGELARFKNGFVQLFKDAIKFLPNILNTAWTFLRAALVRIPWARVALELAKFIPHVRIAALIVGALMIIVPLVMDELQKRVPAIMETLVKGKAANAATGIGLDISGLQSMGLVMPWNMSPVPTAPVQQPTLPSKPLVLEKSRDQTTININNVNIHGVTNAEDVPNELVNSVKNKGGKIQQQGLIPSDFGPRR